MGFPTDIHPPGTEEIKLNMPEHRANEREEGEISDDFEDIISSDEEFSMRKRIEELEARNLELEKIATISGTYNNDLVYPNETQKGGLIELEEVSDVEEYSPTYYDKTKRPTTIPYLPQKIVESAAGAWKNATRYTIKKTYSNLPSIEIEIVNNKVKTKTKARKRKREKVSRSKGTVKKHKVKKKIPRISHTSSDENDFHLNRDELRLALRHDNKTLHNKGNLKNIVDEKYADTYSVKALSINETKDIENDEMVIVNEDHDEEDRESTNSLEENELRLIALKSAFYKKHLERKKRKETEDCKPYSPTDFLNVLDVPSKTVMSPHNSLEDVDYENNAMDISPITSPEYEDSADCILKPTDMDLASSSSCTSPVYVLDSNWEKYQNIPCPPSWSAHVLEEGNECLIEEDNSTGDTIGEDQNKFATMRSMPDENDVVRICNATASVEDSEEEEEALRALLLAKMTSPRVKNELPTPKIEASVVRNEKEDISVDEQFEELTLEARKNNNNDALSFKSEPTISDHDNSLDLDSLRNFLISNMKKKPVSKTELVLKEAVKRLRIQTQGIDDTPEHKQDQSLETTENENSNSYSFDTQLLDTSTCMVGDIPHNNSYNDDFDEVPRSLSRTSQELTCPTELEETENINPTPTVAPEISTQMDENNEEVPIPCVETVSKDVPDCAEVLKEPAVLPIKESAKSSTVTEKLVEKEEAKHIRKPLKTITKNSAKSSTKVVRRTAVIQSKLSPAVKKTVTAIVPKLSTISKTKVINHNSVVTIKTIPNVINPKPINTTTIKNIMKPSRLVTSLDTTRKVQKIVINLGQTDSDSDDAGLFSNFNADCTRNMLDNDDYCDNASPKSIQMDSPCYSPAPITKLNDRIEVSPLAIERTEVKEIKKAISDKNTLKSTKVVAINDIFQSKLDEFLKNARNKCETTKKDDVGQKQNLSQTPIAVRHLPLSSQIEYRQLVNRMKMLEKQKVAKLKKDPNKSNPVQKDVPDSEVVSDKSKENNEICDNPVNTVNGDEIVQNTDENVNSMNEIEEKPKAVIEKSTINKIIKDNNETKLTSPQTRDDSTTINARKLEKYETEYKQTSDSLLQKISATIERVNHAKQEKLKKFMLENELKQLKQKLMEVEKNLQIQNKIISEIYPEICESNKTIVRLRKRHNLLVKASNCLGKNVKGKEYKLEQDNTKIIASKSHELADEIKKLKTLKRSSSRFDSESERKKSLSEDTESLTKNEQTNTVDEEKTIKSNEDIEENKKEDCPVDEQIETLPLENLNVVENECNFGTNISDNEVRDATVDTSREAENVDEPAKPMETTESYIKADLAGTVIKHEVPNTTQPLGGDEDMATTKDVETSNDTAEDMDTTEINKLTESSVELKPDLSVTKVQDTQPMDSAEENLKREPVHSKIFEDYVSPLYHSKIERNVDPHGIICPYQLMGQCDDKECKFVHLPNIG